MSERLIAVARILAPHGVRGEVRAEILTDYPERFAGLRRAYLGPETGPREAGAAPVDLEGHRFHKGFVLLKFRGYDSIGAAEDLRGRLVQVPETETAPLPKGHFYYWQLIGLRVRSTDGRELGVLSDILRTGANDVYVVRDGSGREYLLPATHEVVAGIDLEAGTVTVRPLAGLLD